MYHCFCAVTSVGHEGSQLLIIRLLGARSWGGGAGRAGREEKTRSKHLPLDAGSLEQEPQFPEDFATLPPGGQRRGPCPGFFGKRTNRERGLEGLLPKEAGMDRPEEAR